MDNVSNTNTAGSTEALLTAMEGLFPLSIRVGKGESAIVVAFDSLPAGSLAHAVRRGLQEDLNNAKAGLGDDPEAARARIEAVAEKYRTADFTRAKGDGPGVSDDPAVVAMQIARQTVTTRIKGLKATVTKEQKDAAVKAYFEGSKEALMAEAARQIAFRKESAQAVTNMAGDDILAQLGIAQG